MPEKYRDLAAYVAILALVFAFFADAIFGGKTFLTEGDNVAFHSFIPYLNAAKESGEFPLWVPYIFSGMPSLASFLAAGERSWDFVTMLLFMIPRTLGEVMNDTARLAMWYTIYGWGVYTLMRAKDMRRGVAFFSATAAVFSTWVLVWVMIGHNIKPVSLATLPWLLLALERVRTKFTVLNMLWVLLPMVVLVGATHPQMMFYMGCAAALYMLVELVDRTLTKQDPVSVLRAAGVLAIATIIALATHADAFLATRAYTPYSTRGSAPISQSLSNKQDETGGNDYEYATNWSFSPEETITFFVPNYYGFGKTKDTRGLSMTYWGQMPFTDAANYMGIGVLLLALIGAITRWRDPFVLFLIVLGVFSYLLSMGKNFPLVYDIFYNLVPTFNKFRAPSMALVLLQFATPVLAGFGVASVIGWSEKLTPERKRAALIALGGAAAFLVIGLIYTNAMEQSYKNNVVEALMAKDPRITDKAQIPASYTNKMHDMMASDWMATGMLALGFGLLVYLTATKKVSHKVALGALIALTLIDLWRVDKRPYDPSKDSLEKTTFRQTDLISLLKQDKSMYRVADLGTMPPNALAYHFIEHVHGYSSAKLRVYQDMLDEAGNGGGSSIMNPFLWNMLNVKYLIAGQQIYQNVPPDFQSQETGQLLYVNRTAMPRAWFVNRVQQSDQRTILKHLKDGDFDLRDVAFVEGAVGDVQPTDSTATAQATRIGNQHLSVKVTAPQKNFLVVSEVFYPEWHAFVDGQEVPMHKTNFLIRGVVVPAGTHTVEFKYVSPSFETGRTISLAANGLIIIIAALGFWMERRSRTAQAA